MKSLINILNAKEPADIYSHNITTLHQEYKQYAKLYHPDVNKNSPQFQEAFKIILDLYKKGQNMLNAGVWKGANFISFLSTKNQSHEIHYQTTHDFELGKTYICNTLVVYTIPKTFNTYTQNFLDSTKYFKYADNPMKEEFQRYLPKILNSFETQDALTCIVISKTSDLYSLKDILTFYDGKLPPHHMAWILSSLYNLTCFLNYSKLSHNAITLDNYFISPQFHSGALLGGWFYTISQQSKMFSVPSNIYSIMPPHVKTSKLGNIETDLESIRLIGRQLLGDPNGTRLDPNEVPKPIIEWLRNATSGKAHTDYIEWMTVLTKAFGKRSFIVMPITSDALYNKVGNKY